MSRNAFSLKHRLLKPAMATKSGAALAALICSTSLMTSQASAQLLDLCTGLRANVPVLQPVAGGFLDPLLNGLVSNINTNLLGALSGQTLGISAFDQNGNLISLPGNCRVAVDDVTVNANRGISMGGGQIDGLGGPGNAPAIAGEVNSIALGNGAVTSAGALNSIAIGLRGSVTAVDGVSLGRDTLVSSTGGVALGAGSLALRGGLSGGNEAFSGTAVASTAGALSIGSAGNERQITNVAGGTQDTDAVNVRQLRAVGNNVATSLGGGATFNVSTGGYTGPTYLVGGVAYYDVATAIAAVQTPGGPGFYAPVTGNNTSGYAGPVAAGSDALAVGYGASAGGSRSTALGANANSAGNNAVALGADSVASGTGSTAVGQGASAAHANATAIGNGATTTRANQVAVGNAQSTHTMAGVASAQSVAAQRGTTHLLTTDSAGNIATSNIDINAMDRRLTSLQAETQMNRREARQGIAAAMAMDTAPMPSAPGRTSWAMNTSTFKGEYAGGFSFAHRLNTARPFAITGSYGNSGGNTHGGRVGLAGEF